MASITRFGGHRVGTAREHTLDEIKTLRRQQLFSRFALSETDPMGPSEIDESAPANKIYRFIVGQDRNVPVQLTDQDIQQWLQDPFSKLLQKLSEFPLTLNTVIEAFEKTKGTQNGFKKLSVFHIAEGGQIPWSAETDKVNRSFRLVFAIEMEGGVAADVLISTKTNNDSKDEFLQLMSWDRVNSAFNFYQRLDQYWIWSGNSFHALESATRAKGPFLGHVNGGVVMKELKIPWPHWHSMNATINSNIFSPTDPFVKSRFFRPESGLVQQAQDLETSFIRPLIHLWNSSRIANATKDHQLQKLDQFLRQVIETTNVNLTSSLKAFQSIQNDTVVILPFTFFINSDALAVTGIHSTVRSISVIGKIYLESLKFFNFSLETEGLSIPGDTHFAFIVPEPAAEDVDLLKKLVQKEIMSARLAACLLMIDFTRPIFSSFRSALKPYIPTEVIIGDHGKDLDNRFVANVVASNKHTTLGTPENEFMTNWNLGENQWLSEFSKRIDQYLSTVADNIKTQEGYNGIVRRAEEVRSQFKSLPLYEFPLTFATATASPSQPLLTTIIHKETMTAML